ncbi:uncharacterized protein BROUX77_005352 [Berkeleyomyces rouxiae]|uniref:uncharacterized protein n=1 Tax=Berkeleyomyces rouxiae TaxID=2035830 RepID=UPI003B7958FA
MFDTASTGLWAHSTKTADPEKTQTGFAKAYSHSCYDLQDSTWAMEDPNGNTISRKVYVETLSVGDLTVKGQLLQIVETVSSDFQTPYGVSGVMGMGFSAISPLKPHPDDSVFEYAKYKLDEKVFTVDMKHCSAGQVDFGYIDKDAYIGKIGYSSVNT